MTRIAIIREWVAAGRPPCSVCGAAIDRGGRYRVSRLWRSPVHPYCLQARVGRPSPDELRLGACSVYPDCPIRFQSRDVEYCVCPVVAARNFIFIAARLGQATVTVPTADSPALQDAARRAGLGHDYRDVPLRESLLLDRVRKFGVFGPDESVWDRPATWWEPPEYVTVDVHRTIREGRIVAAGIGGIADEEAPSQS